MDQLRRVPSEQMGFQDYVVFCYDPSREEVRSKFGWWYFIKVICAPSPSLPEVGFTQRITTGVCTSLGCQGLLGMNREFQVTTCLNLRPLWWRTDGITRQRVTAKSQDGPSKNHVLGQNPEESKLLTEAGLQVLMRAYLSRWKDRKMHFKYFYLNLTFKTFTL